jgi:hypothetical protein
MRMKDRGYDIDEWREQAFDFEGSSDEMAHPVARGKANADNGFRQGTGTVLASARFVVPRLRSILIPRKFIKHLLIYHVVSVSSALLPFEASYVVMLSQSCISEVAFRCAKRMIVARSEL